MRPRTLITLFLLFFLTAGVGCGGCLGGGDPAPEAEEEATSDDGEPQSIADAMNKAGKALDDAQKAIGGDGESVEPVDFRKLKDLLPEELPGMERTNAEGQKSGVMGIKMSQAEGTYRGDDATIEISIIDMGTLRGAAMLGYAWLMAEIDRESDRGFERTTKYEGNPAFEKCEQSGERMDCEFQVVVGERFIVSIRGRNVDGMDAIEEAREEVNLGQLERMKDEGA